MRSNNFDPRHPRMQNNLFHIYFGFCFFPLIIFPLLKEHILKEIKTQNSGTCSMQQVKDKF